MTLEDAISLRLCETAKLLASGSRHLRTGLVSQLRASVSGTSQLFKNGRLSSKSFDAGRSVDGGPGVTSVKVYTNGISQTRMMQLRCYQR